MPLTPSLPTWTSWNSANFTSPTGITDMASGQPVAAGGLNLGDYFDATNAEAANASFGANGRLYAGRYRLVQVDSGATAANVKTGTVGYMAAGGGSGAVRSVTFTPGTGATVGTYTIPATLGSGGGSGAVVQVTVGASGAVTAAVVLNGGFNYSSIPSFSLAVTGGTGTVAAQLDASPNFVTSADQTSTTGVPVRPVVFLNSITPGNFGFIQELGIATVLGSATPGTAAVGNFVSPLAVGSGNGTVTSGTTYTATTIGQAVDLPLTSATYKVILNGPTVQD